MKNSVARPEGWPKNPVSRASREEPVAAVAPRLAECDASESVIRASVTYSGLGLDQRDTEERQAEVNIDIGRREIWICAGAILLAACAHATRAKAPGPGAPAEPWRDLLPAPVSAERGAGAFPVAAGMVIVAPQGDAGTANRATTRRDAAANDRRAAGNSVVG